MFDGEIWRTAVKVKVEGSRFHLPLLQNSSAFNCHILGFGALFFWVGE